jgi:hypothetical protein
VRRVETGVAVMLLGTILFAARVPELQWTGLIPSVVGGLALLGVYLLARRVHLALVPPAVAVTIALGQAPQLLFRPYAGAAAGAVMGSLTVLALAVYWSRLLQRALPAVETLPPTTDAQTVTAGTIRE